MKIVESLSWSAYAARYDAELCQSVEPRSIQ